MSSRQDSHSEKADAVGSCVEEAFRRKRLLKSSKKARTLFEIEQSSTAALPEVKDGVLRTDVFQQSAQSAATYLHPPRVELATETC